METIFQSNLIFAVIVILAGYSIFTMVVCAYFGYKQSKMSPDLKKLVDYHRGYAVTWPVFTPVRVVTLIMFIVYVSFRFGV
jgi:hypothetical protein